MQRSTTWAKCGTCALAVMIGVAVRLAAAQPVPTFQWSELPNRLRAPKLIAATDVTGDGRVDLLASGVPGIFILPGDGSGKFPNWYRVLDDVLATGHLAAADFNGDGKLDLAGTATLDNSTSLRSVLGIWLGDDQGHFRRVFDRDLVEDGARAGDFNGDGNMDVLLGRWEWYIRPNEGHYPRSVVDVYLGDGLGGLAGPISTTYPAPDDDLWGPYAIVDLNGDGRADVVSWAYSASRLDVLLADGTGGFRTPLPLASPPTPADMLRDDLPVVHKVACGDLNGDGLTDLLVRFAYRAVSTDDPRYGDPREFSMMYFGDGTGRFSAPVPLTEPLAHQRTVIDQAIADLNGDGRNDILLTGPNAFKNPGPLYSLQPATDVYLATDSGSFSGPMLSLVGGVFNDLVAGIFSDTVQHPPPAGRQRRWPARFDNGSLGTGRLADRAR